MKRILLFLSITVLASGLFAQEAAGEQTPVATEVTQAGAVESTGASTVKDKNVKEKPVKLSWDTDFLFYFDNREFDRTQYQHSQTIFGITLAPEIGFSVSDTTHGHHRIMAGVAYNQPIGSGWDKAKFMPTAYYEMKYKGWSVHLGFVPYKYMKTCVPDYLAYDSLQYTNPNINGALFQYESKKGFVSLFCDWRGMYSEETREAFRIVLTGKYQYKWFYTGGWAQMNHLANSASKEYGVCDDIMVNPFIGFDFHPLAPVMDELYLQAGYIFGVQRNRAKELTYLTHGARIDFSLRWRFLGLQNHLYVGDPLFPLYDKCDGALNQGDPWYQAPLYNRTDLNIYIYNNRFVNCYVSVNFNVTDEGTFNWQQQVIAQFNLSRIFDKKAGKLKSLLGK